MKYFMKWPKAHKEVMDKYKAISKNIFFHPSLLSLHVEEKVNGMFLEMPLTGTNSYK
jgi:hypothetical protein